MIEIVQTMEDIGRKEWNTLAGKDKVETMYEWFQFAQNTEADRELTYCHAVYRDERGIRGILPACYVNTYLKDFAVAFAFFPLVNSLPSIKIPFKVTEVCIPRSIDSRYFGDRKYFNECLLAIERFSRENHHSFIIMRGFNKRINLPDYLCMELLPEAYVDPYPSWDAYLEDQKGKHGKHIRYEYRKSIENGTKTYVIEDLTDYYDPFFPLFMNVNEKNKHIMKFTREYFRKLEEYLSDFSKCIVAENKGEVVGFLFLLENDYFISCKFAGRDYTASDPYVYFRLLYELIRYSTERKKPASIEKTAYDAKARRGFKLMEKLCYVKSNYPMVGNIYLGMVKMANRRMSKQIREMKSSQE